MDISACDHPRLSVRYQETWFGVPPLLEAYCPDCHLVAHAQMSITYSDRFMLTGDRLLRITARRGNLALCAACGRLLFAELDQVPMIVFVPDGRGPGLEGEIDLCGRCGPELLPKLSMATVCGGVPEA